MIEYEKLLSSTIQQIKPSGIRKFFDLAENMEGVISLGVGEPDFQTPWVVRSTAIQTLEKRRIIYSANAGLMDLRREICKYMNRKLGLTYDPKSELIVTVGGSEAIDISIRAVINPGDEVLIVEPSFVCYSPIVRLAGGVPVPMATRLEDSFKLTPEILRSHITPRTKLLVLPFPNNPTGAIMTREELEEIAAVLRDTNILVLSDEIYSELTYGRKHCSIAQIDGMQERTILVNGFSKAFAMTGWRLGYACAPAPLLDVMLKIHQYTIMCAATPSQHAAVEALRTGFANDFADVRKMVEAYDMRRRLMVEGLRAAGLPCHEPMGAFYVFPSVKETGLSSQEFCQRLLYEKKVATVPGDAFGQLGQGHIRCSCASSTANIVEAVARIGEFVAGLK